MNIDTWHQWLLLRPLFLIVMVAALLASALLMRWYNAWRHGLTVGIYGTGTNAEDAPYTPVSTGKNISKGQFVGYIQKTF